MSLAWLAGSFLNRTTAGTSVPLIWAWAMSRFELSRTLQVARRAFLQSVSDVDQHLVEVVALLADGDHFHHVTGEKLARGQRRGQGVAGRDVVGRLVDGQRQDLVAGRVLADAQGVEDRD